MKMGKSRHHKAEKPYDNPSKELSKEVKVKQITIKVKNQRDLSEYNQISKEICMKIDIDVELRWLMILYCDTLGFEYYKFKFKYNGATVRETDTPLMLNMIANDVIYACPKVCDQDFRGCIVACYETLCIRMHKKRDTILRVARTEPLLQQLKRVYYNDKPGSNCFAYKGKKLTDDDTVCNLCLEDGDIIDAFNFDECSSSLSIITPIIRSNSEVNCNGKMPTRKKRSKLSDIPSGGPPLQYPALPGLRAPPSMVIYPPPLTRVATPGGRYEPASSRYHPRLRVTFTTPSRLDDYAEDEMENSGEEESGEDEEEGDIEYGDDDVDEGDMKDSDGEDKVVEDAAGDMGTLGKGKEVLENLVVLSEEELSARSNGWKGVWKESAYPLTVVDLGWRLMGPATGGPTIPDVLPSFKGHIAFALSDNPNKRGVLKPYLARLPWLKKLGGWDLPLELMDLVRDSGLAHLASGMMDDIDMPLISAFVERWQPDTNTFHMPFGEMTILLHDVHYILCLNIQGRSCIVQPAYQDNPVEAAVALFGWDRGMLESPFEKSNPTYRANGILPAALEKYCKGKSSSHTVQSYLMILLGSTLFVDKSRDRVRADMFGLLEDVTEIGGMAWGAGTLAYLYRQLGVASRADASTIAGCLTLLQTWIYVYFPTLRPTGNDNIVPKPGTCLSASYKTHAVKRDPEMLVMRRAQLDRLTGEDVRWTTFGRHPHIDYPRTAYFGLIRFIDIVEPYQPDRCFRQLGYCQMIPRPMPFPSKCVRDVNPKKYVLQYLNGNSALIDQMWLYNKPNSVDPQRVSREARPSHESSPDYLSWYRTHSHLFIGSTSSCSDSAAYREHLCT